MHWIDWALVSVVLAGMLWAMLYTRKYLRSVADFMAGGRCAGRYLLCNAKGEAGYGVATAVAVFEVVYQSGCLSSWWFSLVLPITMLASILGFVTYRYRETRALTLAQFFEMRYSRRFRIFTGMLGFGAGVLSYGITPAIQARFFVYFLGLPQSVPIGSWHVSTYVVIMAAYLACVVLMVCSGGQITLLVTDCLQGMVSQILYLCIAVGLFFFFSWGQIAEALTNRPPNHSLANPFDGFAVQDFNLSYVLIFAFLSLFGTMAWQFGHSFNSAALTPHESRMGGILGQWRVFSHSVMIFVVAICAMTFLDHPFFHDQSEPIRQTLAQMGNAQLETQMRVPTTLSYLLPVGIKGAFCVIMLLCLFAADSSHLHSWGSIFVQDVLLPLRKKHMSTKSHLLALRLAVIGVAVIAFCCSLLFRQTEYIIMWWTVTAAVYTGGAGAVIIGGLYWNRGTAAAAWSAMITGSTLALSGILYKQFHPDFFLNGQMIAFLTALTASAVYVTVSLLTCRKPFNMDWMLHRGAYAVDSDRPHSPEAAHPAAASNAPRKKRFSLQAILDFDENFTRGDKWIAGLLFAWSMFWFFVVMVGTAWNLIAPWPTVWWTNYWFIYSVALPMLFGAITSVWFTWGGVTDLRLLFKRLSEERVDAYDDGTVTKNGAAPINPNEDIR